MHKFMTSAAALVLATSLSSAAWAGDNPQYSNYSPELLPTNPVAGQCYARVQIPAQYEQGSLGVLLEDSYETVQVAQPQLAARQEDILVKEPSVRYEVTQPRYQTVSERMLVSPAYDRLSVTSPTFKTVQETIATSAPHLVWKRGNPQHLISQGYKIHSTANGGANGQGFQSGSNYRATSGQACGNICEIWCLVEEPGESTGYLRKVLDQPARVQRTPVQAKYQTISKQVLAQPGAVREIQIPAEYRSVSVQQLVSPGGEQYVTVPPKYGSVKTKQIISPERYEWRSVVCKPGTGNIRQSHQYSGQHGAVRRSGASTYSNQGYTSGQTYSGQTHSGQTYSRPSASTTSHGSTRGGYNSGTSYGTTTGRVTTGTVSGTSGYVSGSTAPRVYGNPGGAVNYGSVSGQRVTAPTVAPRVITPRVTTPSYGS